MAFAETFKVSVQCVVTILRIELSAGSKFLHNGIEKTEIQSALFGSLVSFFVCRGEFQMICHSSSALFNSSMLS